LANEIIVPKLAQSKTFQRAALKTHEKVQAAKASGAELAKDAATKSGGVAAESSTFFKAFKDEMAKPPTQLPKK
jgi:hypothetical protein